MKMLIGGKYSKCFAKKQIFQSEISDFNIVCVYTNAAANLFPLIDSSCREGNGGGYGGLDLVTKVMFFHKFSKKSNKKFADSEKMCNFAARNNKKQPTMTQFTANFWWWRCSRFE